MNFGTFRMECEALPNQRPPAAALLPGGLQPIPTFSQFPGLLSSASWQDLGQHAVSLHARLTCRRAADPSGPGSCLGAWWEKQEVLNRRQEAVGVKWGGGIKNQPIPLA